MDDDTVFKLGRNVARSGLTSLTHYYLCHGADEFASAYHQ